MTLNSNVEEKTINNWTWKPKLSTTPVAFLSSSLPLRKATGVVESFGFHVQLLIVFSSTLDLSVISTTSCYIYICIYIYIDERICVCMFPH